MDFHQIEQILMVAECGSISEAAKKLFVSQPTISYTLSKAEREFGAAFFDRSSYPLKLTYAGKQYIETARQMRLLYHNLKKICADASCQTAGELNIGFPHNRSAQILPKILKEFYESYPNMKLNYYSCAAETMKEKLYNGELDFCILTKVEQDPRFRYEPLFFEELRAVALEGIIPNALLSCTEPEFLPPKALASLPLLLPDPASGLGQLLHKFLDYHGITPKVKEVVAGNNALYMLAGAGLGTAILPQNILDQSTPVPGLKTYALSPNRLGWTICAIFPEKSRISSAEQFFIQLIREKFCQYPEGMEIFPYFS